MNLFCTTILTEYLYFLHSPLNLLGIGHQIDVSEIHSTPLIVLVFVLVSTTSAGGVNIPLTTAPSIWYDVINRWTVIIYRYP